MTLYRQVRKEQTLHHSLWEKAPPCLSTLSPSLLYRFLHFPLLLFSPFHALALLNVKGLCWRCECPRPHHTPQVFIYIFMPQNVPPQPLWWHPIQKLFSRYIARWALTVKSICKVKFPAVHLWPVGTCSNPRRTLFYIHDTSLDSIASPITLEIATQLTGHAQDAENANSECTF